MNGNFITCGIVGWCLEDLWTGFCAYINKDRKLECRTSIWMFPIYGCASLIKPVSRLLRRENVLTRGFIYMSAIFLIEFVSGSILKKYNMCPWDYSDAPLNIKGLIRLDFAPLWFLAGLLYEYLLNGTPKEV